MLRLRARVPILFALMALLALTALAPGPGEPMRLAAQTVPDFAGGEVLIPHLFVYYQGRRLSCEETAVSMALTHQHIYVSQDVILTAVGADPRPMHLDPDGLVRWGDPYRSFVGSVDGAEHDYTGYGAFYPPLVNVARRYGAKIRRFGTMDAATIYSELLSRHPVVVWATWDWQWHPRNDYMAFDGRWIPWIGPFDAHVYTLAGIRPDAVLVNDPRRGQYWEPKTSFEAAYSDFEEAIAFD